MSIVVADMVDLSPDLRATGVFMSYPPNKLALGAETPQLARNTGALINPEPVEL